MVSLGGSTSLTDHDSSTYNGVWAASGTEGWIRFPLPSGFSSYSVSYENTFSSGEVIVRVASSEAGLAGDSEIVSRSTTTGSASDAYTAGSWIEIRETSGIIGLGLTITVSN